MILNIYKGFDKKFFEKLEGTPLINLDLDTRLNVFEYDNKIKKNLEASLLMLEEEDKRWISYEEYSLIKDRVDLAIKDYDLEATIFVNNLFPDCYPLNFNVPETLFDEIFKYIDNQFEEFESLVESAQYDEANTILPRIDQILHEITTHISDLPALCTTVALVIPEKIATVESAYKELVDQKYPLYHLHVPQTIEEINKKLEQYTHDIRIFSVDNLADKLEDIIKELDSYFDKFDLEKTSKEEFEAKNESVYSTVNLIERNFIKLRNTIPEVSKYFVINEEHLSGINDIQSAINRVGALKRSLDTFIHSATKQPYSSLVTKMRELSEATSSIISDIDEFNSYIGSLKSDAESAYAAVFSFYSKVKKAEEQVREINVQKINDKYNPRFENLFELLNKIYESLTTSPIDIENVNNLLHQFYEDANALLDDGEVAQDYNMMLLAENAIIFANRHRNHLSDIDTLLSQAETYFENGDFENAYVLAGNTLKKIKDTNGR